jgi:hypothetical protein
MIHPRMTSRNAAANVGHELTSSSSSPVAARALIPLGGQAPLPFRLGNGVLGTDRPRHVPRWCVRLWLAVRRHAWVRPEPHLC